MTKDTQSPLGGARAWLIWSLSAAAFGYAFFQRVAPSVMVSDLMAEFAIGGAVMGYLSALYFYPYVALQIPLGALLDRLGPRKILTTAIGLAAVGSYLFGSAGTIEQAYAGRMLVGIGSAVGFLGSLSLAAKWFPAKRFALLTGLTMLAGMSSGVGAQAPLAALIESIGWRNAMFSGAAFASCLALAIFVFVRDAPADTGDADSAQVQTWSSVWRGFVDTIRRREIWLIAIVATAMSGPMLAFGGLWGVPYMMTAYGLERPDAAFYVSMLLVGWAIGAPLGGWWSDHIERRKAPVLIAAIVEVFLMCLVVFIPGLPLYLCVIIILGIGIAGGGMATTFALAREVSSPETHGSVSGIVNAMTVASGAILQPVIGLLLDWQWDGTMADGARVYGADHYRTAFICLVAWSSMAVLACLRLRETYCTPVRER